MVTTKEREEVLAALGRYRRAGALTVDVQQLFQSLQDESDRAMVVILGSMTEDLIVDQIFKRMGPFTEKQKSVLTKSGAVLSHWNNIIGLALVYEIIGPAEVRLLKTLKTIRNACAHSRRHIDFSTPELREAVGIMIGGAAVDAVRAAKPPQVRIALVMASSYLWLRISGQSKEAAEHGAAAPALAALRGVPPSREKPKRR